MFDRLSKNRFRKSQVNKTRVMAVLLVVSVTIIVAAHTTPAQTTTFTYQGRLTDAGAPASGAYDLEFKLYGASGVQVGTTLIREDVEVIDSVFIVPLDFGVSPFASAAASMLEIGVRPAASGGAFTALAPRQPITSTPYAIKTVSASQLGGVAADQFVQTNDARLSDARDPIGGSSNYVQSNPPTQQAGVSFNVSGNGTVGGTLSASNVGIGTATPNHRLSIEGSGITESSVRSTNERAILILDSRAGGQRRIWTLESGVFGNPGLFGIYDRNAGQARLLIGQNGNVGIGTSFLGSKLTVDGGIWALGSVRFNSLAVQGTVPLCRSGNGFIAFCSSSLRYKKDLQPFSEGLNVINKLRPISFKWKWDAARDVGFGAEDVAQVDPLFVTYNDKGQVEGVKYDRLSVVFVNAIKEQQAQIDRQQKQIEDLKKLVCHSYPTAEACKE